MSSTVLSWFQTARDNVENLPGVSSQIQVHLLLQLCLKAMPDGHIPTARTRDIAEWLMVSKPTAKKVVDALATNGIIEVLGAGSLQLCMCDNVVEKETEFHDVGEKETELPQNFQNVGKDETEFHDVGKIESESDRPAGSDSIVFPPTYYVSSRERVRAHARTREAAALASPPDLSALDNSEAQVVLADFHRVFEHGVGLSLSPSKRSLVLRSCAEHGVDVVRNAIRDFEAEMVDAREDPSRQAWSWDRNKRPVPLNVLEERIDKIKTRAVAAARRPIRKTSSRGYSNDVWASDLAAGEKGENKNQQTVNRREIKSCL